MSYKNNKGPHTNIIAWQEAVNLNNLLNELLSKIKFLDFKLKSQVMNASDSVIANIVEGYYSKTTGDYIRFCRYARRSCAELKERMIILAKRNIINNKDILKFDEQAIRTGYLIDRLIAGLEKKKAKNQS